MAKWFGKIGYEFTEEIEPGGYEPRVVEQNHYGDILSDRWSRQTSPNGPNDNINLANTLSIIADPFANEHCSHMAYAVINGTKWKITYIDTSGYPRLTLSIGGVYNGIEN